VCEVLLAALGRHGIPDQILTDNGKVFTGRFGPAEVLFDRICAENGIRHLLTAPVRQPLPACPHDLATKPRASVSTARSVQSYINEFREGASATHQAATLIDFASKPLIVITAAEDMTEGGWLRRTS
jgi:hypothetical protein